MIRDDEKMPMSVEILDKIQDKILDRSNACEDAIDEMIEETGQFDVASAIYQNDDLAVAIFRRVSLLTISGATAFRFMLPDESSVSDVMMTAYVYGVDLEPGALTAGQRDMIVRTAEVLDAGEDQGMPDMTAAQAIGMAEKLVDEANKKFGQWFPMESYIRKLSVGLGKDRVDPEDADRFQRLFRRAFAGAAESFKEIVAELRAEYGAEELSAIVKSVLKERPKPAATAANRSHSGKLAKPGRKT